MLSFVPSKLHLRHSLFYLFHQKKKAAEAHRLLVETYGEHAPVIKQVRHGFVNLKMEILTMNILVKRKSSKTRNCRPYWMKTQPNHNNNWHKH
ncbi:Hypothetical protein CINCED_3A008689 [Cinara cedri]|uniref:Mos1 transposase HTH domain-containing protein n=1 Tax=Cinara cedri TaxID=506608 RepID=A0A5E4ML79_9HEMI|nr:Hypothetical protein CINCED_3A008689 [Cinara cedri]